MERPTKVVKYVRKVPTKFYIRKTKWYNNITFNTINIWLIVNRLIPFTNFNAI